MFERINSLGLIFGYRVKARIVSVAVKQYLGETINLSILDYGSSEGLKLS